MKRKRRPAPRKNKRTHNQVTVEEERIQESESEDDCDIEHDEESFHGFSTDDEELENEKDKETAHNGDIGHTAKKGKKSVPTKEELMDLFLRSSSFQSNLFKLQTEQLLSEVRVKYDKMASVEAALHGLKEVIMAIPTSDEQLVSN
jgi:U3 small nucleolar RNA-associated protein 22